MSNSHFSPQTNSMRWSLGRKSDKYRGLLAVNLGDIAHYVTTFVQ